MILCDEDLYAGRAVPFDVWMIGIEPSLYHAGAFVEEVVGYWFDLVFVCRQDHAAAAGGPDLCFDDRFVEAACLKFIQGQLDFIG